MNQSFFTLSLGIGAMEIFGSYMEEKRTLAGESVSICILDTFVALSAGSSSSRPASPSAYSRIPVRS